MDITHEFLDSLMDESHPFKKIRSDNLESMMANYFAMSQAFPYLQSGSQKTIFDAYIKEGTPIDKDFEVTSVVGNFLSWDETGGLYVTLRKKMAGVSAILKTDEHFHANYLRNDLERIFNRKVLPLYSDITKKYLDILYLNLSDRDSVKRCATMVSFEEHANQMIDALWNSIAKLFPNVNKDELRYFYNHVGGNDPAEAYHVKMTEEMIAIIANTPEKKTLFTEHFKKMYDIHIDWCREIVING